MKKKSTLIIIFLFASFPAFGETPQNSSSLFSLHLNPGLSIPLGASADYFKLGGNVKLAGEYALPAFPSFYLGGEIGYQSHPIKAEESISILSLGARAGFNFPITSMLYGKVSASLGGYYSFFNTASGSGGGSSYLSVGTGLSLLMIPAFSLGLYAKYTNYFYKFLQGIELQLGAAYHFGVEAKKQPESKRKASPPVKPEPLKEVVVKKGEGVEVREIAFESIFPVFFGYYDDHPIGRAKVYNFEAVPVSDLKVSVFVKQYMDLPKECETITELKAGESRAIELYALFTDKVLEITEGTKAAAEITVDYTLKGEKQTYKKAETIRIQNRNAVTWDDNRKASAFVTAKDPAVLEFSKNVAAWIRGEGSKAINENLSLAMAVHYALKLFGLTYAVDPATPFKEYSQDRLAVDFLQFPVQTLKYRAGDCDDLSILYAALLEALGIETAFITIPGHIFIAFSVDMSPAEARKSFLYPD
ncbi:MAG: hypothetical protein AB1798_23775, partial [Spirochaetota bacterium]